MTAKIVFDGPGDVWFFAYGSLMWDPGFAFAEQRPALLRGYHRRFCVDSTVYRGTPERPGLVLGLDAGGACRGLAYRIARCRREAASRYLDRRELAEDIYLLRKVTLETAGRRFPAIRWWSTALRPTTRAESPPRRKFAASPPVAASGDPTRTICATLSTGWRRSECATAG